MSKDNDRYEVKEEKYNTNPLGPFSAFLGGEMNGTNYTVTDTETGKEYEAFRYDRDQAKEAAWKKVDEDR